MPGITYPDESDEYRTARDELLAAEAELRRHVEEVAARRRALPPGGVVPEDYAFTELVDGKPVTTRLSELFGAQDTLFLYSFMYGPEMETACPSCTSMLDGLDGQVRHIDQSIATAVVAKHDIDTIHAHARDRGWSDLRLVSSAGTTYNADYHGEVEGGQMTMANVFTRDGDEVRHFWGSELVFAPSEDGQEPRHADAFWPLWNVLDLTPGGRGEFHPALRYD